MRPSGQGRHAAPTGQSLQLPQVLRLGEGESKSGGKLRPSILADALEAFIGAVYLDAGYGRAEALVHRLFEAWSSSPRCLGRQGRQDRVAGVAAGPQMKLPQYGGGHHGRGAQPGFHVDAWWPS